MVQQLRSLDFASLSAYFSSTRTRHDLVVHSVNPDAAWDDPTLLPSTTSTPASTTSTSRPSRSPNRTVIASTVSMANERDLQTSPGNMFSVYDRPFVVNDQWRDADLLVWAQSLPHVPAVLHFNAGLCCHRRACRTALTADYRRALAFYVTAGRLLEANARAGGYLTEVDILLLAVANNVGHIYSHLSCWDGAQSCLDRMLAVFVLSECKALMTMDEYVFFHINILLFTSRWPILAGAA